MADEKEEAPESPDVHFEPVVTLAAVDVETLEENEEEMIKMRAKLFRYDSGSDPAEWKERGTGEVKLLKHKAQGTCRLLMRRDKTLKVCANHAVLPLMELKPNCGSDRAWVWSTPADYADEEAKSELLAIRFANADNAQKFKVKFEEAKKIMEGKFDDGKSPAKDSGKPEKVNGTEKDEDKSTEEADKVAEKLGSMSVKDGDKTAETQGEKSTPSEDKSPETGDAKASSSEAEVKDNAER